MAPARAIVAALEALPEGVGGVDAQVRVRAEERLVADAATFTPAELERLGQRVLEVVAPEVGEEQERRALERLSAGPPR